MEKKTACITGSEEEGMVLGDFLRTRMGLGKKEISRAKFLENGICVNGIRKKITAVLREGDLVEVCLETSGTGSPQLVSGTVFPDILYEDSDVLVMNKPAGLSVHPAGKGGYANDTLANRLAYYLRTKGEDCVIRIPGRLDKDTSGVVLAAKNRVSCARLERQRQEGVFQKTYLALCHGVPPKEVGVICAALAPCPEDRTRMQVSDGGLAAQTCYEVVRRLETRQGVCTLVRLRLKTGRMHQIRVHMASLGCPLLGDTLYGRNAGTETEGLIGRTALHAAELTFQQPFTGEDIRIQASTPKDIARILDSVIE